MQYPTSTPRSNNIEDRRVSSEIASYLTGLNAASKMVYRYPADLGGAGTVEQTPFVVFSPYKRKGMLASVNPASVLPNLPSPTFHVVLPLPSTALCTQYGVSYAPVTLGAALAGQMQTFSATKPGSDQYDSFKAKLKNGGITNFFKEYIEGLTKGGQQLAETELLNIATIGMYGDQEAGLESIYGLSKQRPNPFTENLFKDVNFREHEFTYVFMPRSAQESITIDEIIKLMRFFMLPAYGTPDVLGNITGVNGAVLDFPYEFQILYSVQDTTFMLLPSVMTEMNVDYGGGTDSPQFFTAKGVTPTNKNYPARISVTMRFKEMMILTRNRAEANTEAHEADAAFATTTEGSGEGSATYTRFRY